MKKLILIIGYLIVVLSNVYTQTYNQVNNIKTPNGTIVQDVYELTSSDVVYNSAQLDALRNDLYTNYNGAILIDAPSYKYNCHSYAWNVSEGGRKVWIGYYTATAEDIYWTDGSYIEVPENVATKVSYNELGNHSAIRLDANWCQSKWGTNALIKHHLNDVPSIYKAYLPKKFYVKNTLSISGPSTVCVDAPGTFSVNNLPSGCSVQWSVNNPSVFSLSSTSGTTTTVTSAEYNNSGTLSAAIYYQGNLVTTVNKDIYSCYFEISGDNEIGETAKTYKLKNTIPGISKYKWTVSPNLSFTTPTINSFDGTKYATTKTVDIKATGYNQNISFIALTVTMNNGREYSTITKLSAVVENISGIKIVQNQYNHGIFEAYLIPWCYANASCFHWTITKGSINGIQPPLPHDPTDPITDPGLIGVKGSVPVEDLGNLINALQTNNATADVDGNNITVTSGNYSATVSLSSPELSGSNLEIENVRIAESLSNPELSSILIEMKKMDEDSTEQYVHAYITPLNGHEVVIGPPGPDPLPAICDQIFAEYPSNEIVTITCTFTYNNGTPVSTYYTIFPNNYYYSISYAPSIKSINVQPTQNNSENGTFNLIISNNSSVIGTYTINSIGQLMQIPVGFLPTGTYYVTITDQNGNIMDSQSLSIY